MYEQHIFPDGPKIFNRLTNQYVDSSDDLFQSWINETRPVYTYETQQQEVQVTVVDPETGEDTTTTEMQDVQVAIPVMITTGEGNEIQQTEPANTLRVVDCSGPGVLPVQPDPTDHDLLMAIAEIMEGELA